MAPKGALLYGNIMSNVLFKPLPLFKEFLFFLAVNVLDVLLTFTLLSLGSFEEANIFARYVLQNFGFNGLIIFKYAVVLLVTCIIQIIATKELHTARRVIVAGTIFIGLVDLWSLGLLVWYFCVSLGYCNA